MEGFDEGFVGSGRSDAKAGEARGADSGETPVDTHSPALRGGVQQAEGVDDLQTEARGFTPGCAFVGYGRGLDFPSEQHDADFARIQSQREARQGGEVKRHGEVGATGWR